jgi:hypothetical protein
MDSIANPHLNDDPGAIIAFPGETFGLAVGVPGVWHAHVKQPLFARLL